MNDMTESATVVAKPSGASVTALVAREAQDVMVQMMAARQYPRDVLRARDKVINAFTRLGLCEKALYAYARGGTEITGLSIRAAEELARQWGNIRCGVVELTRQGGVSEVLAFAQDLETGYSDEKRFHIRHIRQTKEKGAIPLTDDRDIYEHVANTAARRKRACILAVIPSDIAEDAQRQVDVTLKAKVNMTPERIQSMVEKFAELGVTKEAIEKRLQRHLDSILPAQFLALGRIYTSIEDGMSEASSWFEFSSPSAEPGAASDPPSRGTQAEPAETRTGELKEALRAQQRKTDTPQRDRVMNSPASAAEGAEARDPNTSPRKVGGEAHPAEASTAQAASVAAVPAGKAAGAQAASPVATPDNALARKPAPPPPKEDAIPHFDERTAIEALNAVTNLGQFKDITAQIGDDYRDTDREIPETVIEASERRQEEICIAMLTASTTLKKLNAAYDRVVASYGPNVPDRVVEAFKAQQHKIEKAGR